MMLQSHKRRALGLVSRSVERRRTSVKLQHPRVTRHGVSTLSQAAAPPDRASLSIHHQQQQQQQQNLLLNHTHRCFNKRSHSTLSSLSNYVKDVIQTRSLQPSNPILSSVIPHAGDSSENLSTSTVAPLPEFHRMLPYHLEKAVIEVENQYKVDLAELEVSLTGVDARRVQDELLERLDAVEAPVQQLLQVGKLFTTLASPPDQLQQWETAYAHVRAMVKSLPWRQSKLIYDNLSQQDASGRQSPKTASQQSRIQLLRLEFEKRGAHIPDDPDARLELRGLQDELDLLHHRLQQSPNYLEHPKALRLQLVSDLYNWVGLSQVQAQRLGHPNVTDMTASQRLVGSDAVLALIPKVGAILRKHLPSVRPSLDEAAGAFLPTPKSEQQPTEEQKALWKAKYMCKKMIRLHGVLQAVADFFDGIFGIRVQPDESKGGGWSKNVNVLHLFEKETNVHLGTIYFDPFRDSYWRADHAMDHVDASLFSQNMSQSSVPVAIVSLKVTPTWDDAPTPLSWDDTRDLLYELGRALQMILSQSKKDRQVITPVDTSEFLGAFMEMWIQNDGFLKRIVDLSQNEMPIDTETSEPLRTELMKEKALDIMQSAFLGSLQMKIALDFDPRGEETLAALQKRLSTEYTPHRIPDSNDLSPILEMFQSDDNVAAYSPLLSEVLAAMAYETFQKTDLRDQQTVYHLGTGIRQLFYRETDLTLQDFETLCGSKLSTGALERVYKF